VVLSLLLLALTVSACEFDKTAVPATTPRLVIHAVLNPLVGEYRVLVEELATGQIELPDRAGTDSLDPILSGGGIPVRDAIVRIQGPVFTATGVEDASVRPDGKGQGVYRFLNRAPPSFPPPCPSCLPVIRGQRYALTVEWRGRTVRGFTTVPVPDRLVFRDFGLQPFNRDRDSLVLAWPTATLTKRFALRATTPYGPFLLFSDRDSLRIQGELRNIFARDLPYVFVPGFRQEISTAAVDTNYFDYYRSSNNPFTGTGLINHLEGAVGLFGSIVPLDVRRLDVSANQDEAIEGRYVAEDGSETIELYLGDELGNDRRQVTGSIRTGASRRGFVGTASGAGVLSFAVLRGDYANDTLYVFSGRAVGDILTGAPPDTPTVTYRRAPRSIARTTRR